MNIIFLFYTNNTSCARMASAEEHQSFLQLACANDNITEEGIVELNDVHMTNEIKQEKKKNIFT